MPITLDGSNGITTPTYGGADTSEYLVPVTQLKNKLINSDMRIDQRNAGASVTVTDAFTVDRWQCREDTDGAVSVQQISDAPAGFSFSQRVTTTTADASLTGIQRLFVEQPIEGFNTADLMFGTANAKTVTLSFWVKSSLTGTFAGALQNSARNRSYVFNYTISSAGTWEYKTVTISGDTTGTWIGATNGVGLRVNFSLGIGPDYTGTANSWQGSQLFASSGAVSVIGTLNATWQLTGVQLEVGSTATSFDYRPYGTELALCQRYYEKSFNIGTAPVSGVANPSGSAVGVAIGSTDIRTSKTAFLVNKRAAPTVTLINTDTTSTSGRWAYFTGSAWADGTGSSLDSVGESGFVVIMSVSGRTFGQGLFISGNWTASAEL